MIVSMIFGLALMVQIDDGFIVGMDIGTTYSSVAVYRANGVEAIPNELGNRAIPSFVAFVDEDILVGEAAKNQATLTPKSSIFGFKRLIGRGFNEKEVQNEKILLPYNIVEKNNRAFVEVKMYDGETKLISPEELTAIIIKKLKTIAETHLGGPVTQAVITIPANFNDAQRAATKDAGFIAGLSIIKVINEPTAAAIANKLKQRGVEKYALVFDFGGGTLDVSIVHINGNKFQILATAGDTYLGGEDFDQILVEYLMSLCKNKHDIDLTTRRNAIQKLKIEAERAKIKLSTFTQATIDVPNLISGFDFKDKISRSKFQELSKGLFDRILAPITNALEYSGLNSSQLNEIVLVGGSSNIPMVQEILKKHFEGNKLTFVVDSSEAVAYGAAWEAAVIGKRIPEGLDTDDIIIVDIVPRSLGLKIYKTQMSIIIPRSSKIPVTITEKYTTTEDNQDSVNIEIYEGDYENVYDNCKLGNFKLTNIPLVKAGELDIPVTFKVDANGILIVTADANGTNANSIIIENNKGGLAMNELLAIKSKFQKSEEYGKFNKEIHYSRDLYENYLVFLQGIIKEDQLSSMVSTDIVHKLRNDIKEHYFWLFDNTNARDSEYMTKLKEIKKQANYVVSKIMTNNNNEEYILSIDKKEDNAEEINEDL